MSAPGPTDRPTAGGHVIPPAPTTPDWTPEDAPRLALESGIGTLGDHHWKVIASCREEVARTGRVPDLERMADLAGLGVAELRLLFPGDAAGVIARVAGLRPWPPDRRPSVAVRRATAARTAP